MSARAGAATGTPIFDIHARLAPRPGAVDTLLATMDGCGIDRAAICSGGVIDLDRLARQIMTEGHIEDDADNDAVLEACSSTAGRLLPFFFGNPHRGERPYREQVTGFRGLEISPAVHGVPLTDERTMALVEVAATAGHPVYVVCIGRRGCGARDLVALAQTFPDTTFVLGHCGFIGIDVYSVDVVAPYPTILAETSGCYAGVAGVAIERLGADRVLLGTEYPLQHPDVELTKLRTLRLDADTWERITWRNACRLLGEPEHRIEPSTRETSHV
ncbi:MAG: amidohydrolase family protein [Streptosporangiales bacterium]|nr:amidohydrolase family protein [Streptosporangiales bacterium]